MRSFRLRTKIILFFLALSSLLIIAMIAFIAYNIKSASQESAFNEAKAWSESYASQVAIELNSVQYATNELSHLLGLFTMLPNDGLPSIIEAMLETTLAHEKRLLNVWVVLDPGIVAPGVHFRRGWHRMGEEVFLKTYADEPLPAAYEKAKVSMKTFLAEPYDLTHGAEDAHEKTTELASSIVAPIMSADGKMIGVVGADFGLSYFQDKLGSVRVFDSGYGELLTDKGTIITGREPDRIGKNAHELEDDRADLALAALSKGEPLGFVSTGDEHGTRAYKYLAPVNLGTGTAPWSFLIVVPVDEVLAKVNRLIFATIMIGAIGLLLLALVVMPAISRLIKPLNATVGMLEEIAGGKGDLTRVIETRQGDEVGLLAVYFNRFTASLRGMIANIVSAATELSKTGKQLSMNMETVASAVTEITANVRSLREGVDRQADSIASSSSSIDRIVERIERLNGLVEDQTASVAQSSSSIE